MTFQRALLATMIAASLSALTGCGSGDGPDIVLDESQPAPLPVPEPEPPEPRLFNNGDLKAEPSLVGELSTGTYRYTRTGPGGDTETGLAIVSPSGRISFALDNRTSFARVQVGENGRFSERLLDTESALLNQSRSIIGGRDRANETPESGERIIGAVNNDLSETLVETFLLERQASDSLELTLAALAATYSGTSESGIQTTLTFDNLGRIQGSDSTGCEFEGTSIIPDNQEDVIELMFSAENCGPTAQIDSSTRNGDYFALGRVDLEAQSVQIFAGNEAVAARFVLQDTQTPPPPEAPAGFVNDDFELESSVVNRLQPGIFLYTDLPLEEPEEPETPDPDAEPVVIEEGVLIVSPTGRIGLFTDRRAAVSRIQVSDLDTFTNDIRQAQRVSSEEQASPAASMFGTPNNPTGTGFGLIGSLLNANGELENRYEAVRNDSDDAALQATPLTMGQLTGIYSQTANPGNLTTTYTIAADGTVTGSDTTGCSVNGVANIPDAELPILEMRLSITNCTATTIKTGEQRNGDYSVVGEITLDGSDTINLLMASDQNLDALSLERQ